MELNFFTGKSLYRARRAKKMSITELAEQLNVPVSVIQEWETQEEKRTIPDSYHDKILDLFSGVICDIYEAEDLFDVYERAPEYLRECLREGLRMYVDRHEGDLLYWESDEEKLPKQIREIAEYAIFRKSSPIRHRLFFSEDASFSNATYGDESPIINGDHSVGIHNEASVDQIGKIFSRIQDVLLGLDISPEDRCNVLYAVMSVKNEFE